MVNSKSFTQSIVADTQSNIRDVKQTIVVASTEQIYLNVEFYNLESDPSACVDNVKNKLDKLQAGNNYQIKISASLNRRGKKNSQESVPVNFSVNSDIELLLMFKKPYILNISNPKRPVSYESLDKLAEEFQITVAQECPTEKLEIYLLYKELQSDRWENVATFKIQLEGTYNQEDPTLLEVCKIAPNVPLPEYTAILHVEEPQLNIFRLKGWSYRGNPCKVNSIDRPTVGLSNFVEGEIQAEDIRNDIRKFSRQCPNPLLEWLQKLVDLYSEKLCIVIADHTNSDFPWEMLELEDDQYLGALAVVTRWIAVKHYTKWHELRVQEQLLSGTVIAYWDKFRQEDTQEKRIILDSLRTEYCKTPAELKKTLSKSLGTVGLVYLSCDGIFTYSEDHKNAVSSLYNPPKRFVKIPFESIKKQEGSRPLFFVNASHSARLVSNSNQCYGLPEVILARIAEGYIGTLGFVEQSHSFKIAQSIIKTRSKPTEGIRAAEILRQLRAQAVTQLNANETSDSWHEFIYTFMYVYYGNPQILLKLTDSEAAEVES